MCHVHHLKMKRFRNARGNPVKWCVISSKFCIWHQNFNQLDAKSKDTHRHEIICTGSTT